MIRNHHRMNHPEPIRGLITQNMALISAMNKLVKASLILSETRMQIEKDLAVAEYENLLLKNEIENFRKVYFN